MQLPRAIDLVLLIKYDARAAKIKLSGILCYYYFFVNEMLSQINQKKLACFKGKCVYYDVKCLL